MQNFLRGGAGVARGGLGESTSVRERMTRELTCFLCVFETFWCGSSSNSNRKLSVVDEKDRQIVAEVRSRAIACLCGACLHSAWFCVATETCSSLRLVAPCAQSRNLSCDLLLRLSTQQGRNSRTKWKHLERSLLSHLTMRIPSAEIDTEAAYILF